MHLAYDEAGTGDPAVLLLHGWGFGARFHLAPQLAHLASRHRVLALDMPGQGRTGPPPGGFGFDQCAAAVIETMDGAGVDRAVLCGHSFGGRLAVVAAAAFPERVAAAMLLDPVILFPSAVRQQALGLANALESEQWRPALEAYFGLLLGPFDPPEVRAAVLDALGEVQPPLAAVVMRDGMKDDASEPLARVRCPLLVVRHSDLPLDANRLLELQPDAWLGSVVGTGHYMGLTVPGQVNAMLDRFLEVQAPAAT